MNDEDIRKFMSHKREIKMEIVSPRGTSCSLYGAPPGTRLKEQEREDTQVETIKAFMEKEVYIERVRSKLSQR